MRRVFRLGGFSVGLVSLLFLGGCKLDDNTVQPAVPVSYVALYNASPDAPGLNVTVDNKQVNSQPFKYADYTGYLPFYTGVRHFSFLPSGANNVVIDTTVTFVADNAYSVFVVDSFNNASVLVLKDSADTPAAGKAVVRLVNLSPDAGTLHLAVKGQSELASGEAFKGATPYLPIDANATTFEVTGNGIALEVPASTIKEGNYYTIVVRGYKNPPTGSTSLLSAQIL